MSKHLFKQAGIYNNFPKDFNWPKLPPEGTVVKFKILAEPSNQIVNGKIAKRYPAMFTLPPVVTIYDSETQANFQACIVLKTDKDGNIDSVHKTRFNAHATNGYFYFTIGKSPVEDAAYMLYLMASERKRQESEIDDPYPDASFGVTPIYEMINEVSIAQRKKESLAKKYAAFNHAQNLKEEELRDVAILLGMPDKADVDVLRASIMEYADMYPKDYLLRVNDEDKFYKQLCLKALSSNLLHVDGHFIKFTSDNRIFVTMTTDNPAKAPDEFANHIKTNKAAEAMVEVIKKMIDEHEGKQKSKSVGRPKKDA